MRAPCSTLALVAASLLVQDVAAAPFNVPKRDVDMVTDEVLVTEQVTVVDEGDGSYATGVAVAIATTTIAGQPVVVSSVASAASAAPVVPTTSSSTPVAAPAPSSSASSSSSAAGAVLIQENRPSTTPVVSVAPVTTSAAPATTPTTLATVASSSSAAAASGSSTSSSDKRGLAYNDASILANFVSSASKVSWAYNWGQTTSSLPSGLEYVPMLWGLGSSFTSGWSAAAQSAIDAGSTHLLAFNEPDLAAQSNIGYADAATGYKTYMEPFAGKAKLGAPAVTNGGSPMGLTWLANFLTSCSSCTIDFVPIHWYSSADVSAFQSYIAQAYAAAGNRPLWITEFQASGTTDEQNTFLEAVLPWLDEQDYVERYAYFMASDGNLLSTGSTLSTLGTTYATYT